MNTEPRAATMKTTLSQLSRGLGAALLLTALASCGGSGPGTGSTSTTGTTGGTSSSTDKIELGSTSGGAFTNDALVISPSSISATGSTTVTANILDLTTGQPYTQSATVTFSSVCSKNGSGPVEASLTPASITTTNGTASSTYQSAGCPSSDTITAQATINGTTLSATGTVTIAPATVASIEFLGTPVPADIGLAGMGGVTSSKVTFQVNDINGNPVPNATVNFSLSTTVGGISLNPASGTTNSSGQTFTFVQAGTQHTTVGVTATTTAGNQTVSATSSSIIVSTGIPTQNNFTIALKQHNIEAWHIVNVTDLVTVLLSDRFQEPVPDGTAVSIITDAGAITPTSGTSISGCTTVNGTCTVDWRSQEAWPDPTEHPDFTILGHAHILAYAIGEESFNDANGDGVIDNNETFYDLPEIFQDRNEDNTYHSASPTDFFYDFNQNGQYDVADGLWEGALCEDGATCGPAGIGSGSAAHPVSSTTGIGVNECIVVSTSFANISAPSSNTVLQTGGSVTFTVSDQNGEVFAEGTKITVVLNSVSADNVTLGPSTGNNEFDVPDVGCAGSRVGWPKTFTLTVVSTSATPTPPFGSFQILVTSPSGASTISAPVTIN